MVKFVQTISYPNTEILFQKQKIPILTQKQKTILCLHNNSKTKSNKQMWYHHISTNDFILSYTFYETTEITIHKNSVMNKNMNKIQEILIAQCSKCNSLFKIQA